MSIYCEAGEIVLLVASIHLSVDLTTGGYLRAPHGYGLAQVAIICMSVHQSAVPQYACMVQ